MWLLRIAAGAASAASSSFSLLRSAGAAAWRGASLRGLGAGGGLSPAQSPACRALHCSKGALGSSRNLLKKFLSKKKKKFWYESPALSSHLTPKPSSLANVLKLTPPKFKKEDSTRKKILNVLLFKAVRDVLSTCDAGEEVYDLCVELSKASLTSDFSICRIYWRTTGDMKQDDHIEKVLQKSAPRIRHILITHQVLGNVPSIVFVRDKEDAIVREIERLLATADMGPEEGGAELVLNDLSEQSSTASDMYLDSSPSSVHANLFGIDHEALNKQILEYKRMKKDKEIEGIGLSEQQQQQLAEIRKQKKMRWKKTKKPFDDDITPQKYLMDKYSEAYWDHETASPQENQLEHESDEPDDEVEIDSRTTKVK